MMTNDDYRVYLINHKNTKIGGSVMVDEDGFASIYLNARRSADQQRKTFEHELRHLEHDDLNNEDDIELVEARATAREIIPQEQKPAMPSFAEQFEAIYQRGFTMFGLERNDWRWDVLWSVWMNRNTKRKYEDVDKYVLKEISIYTINKLIRVIFLDYFTEIGRVG